MTAQAAALPLGPAARRPRRRRLLDWRLIAPLGLAYALFFLAPLLLLATTSFYNNDAMTEFGVGQWQRFLGDAFYLEAVFDTLKLGALTVAATAILAFPLALVYYVAGPRWQRVILFIVILPLLTSVVVRTFAWIVILGREGVINQTLLWLGWIVEPLVLLQTELGLVLALTQIEMPLMLLPLCAVMSRIDPNLIDASRALGAALGRTIVKVILPLSLPGLIAGCLLVFASSVTAFISQSVIGGGRLIYLPTLIWQQAMVVYNWPFAAAISLTLLASVLVVVAVLNTLAKRTERKIHG